MTSFSPPTHLSRLQVQISSRYGPSNSTVRVSQLLVPYPKASGAPRRPESKCPWALTDGDGRFVDDWPKIQAVKQRQVGIRKAATSRPMLVRKSKRVAKRTRGYTRCCPGPPVTSQHKQHTTRGFPLAGFCQDVKVPAINFLNA